MRSSLLLFVGLALCQAIFAQNQNWKFQKTLDSLLETKNPGAENPGFAVCIVENGQIVYERQFGMANVQVRKPIGPETTFNIGSVTKQFTAACILLLEEQGKLRRSDPVQKFIPELPDFGETITLDHLIGHTSGLHDHFELLNLRGAFKKKRLKPEFVFSFLKKSPVLASPPGTNFAYNNTAYMLLSVVVERVSGMKTADFMQKNLFEPLGMKTANFNFLEKDGLPDGTASYEFQPGKKRFKKTKPIGNALGATGVHCTLRDLARWQINFDKNRLGKNGQGFVREMEKTLALRDGTPVYYGAGLVLKNYLGIPTVEHCGGWNSFLLQCRRFPEQGLSVLVASNNDRSSPFPMADQICDKLLVFKKLPATAASNLAALPIPAERLDGKYLSFNNRLRSVRRDGDTLKIVPELPAKGKEIALIFQPLASSDTLLAFVDPATGLPVNFSVGKNGQVRGLFWAGGDYFQCYRFFEKLDETPVELKNLKGKYRAIGYKQKVKVKQKAGGLKLKPVFFLGYRLEPLAGFVFKLRGEPIVVRFSENGMVLGHDWLFNLRFSKKR